MDLEAGWPTVRVVRRNNPDAIPPTHASEQHKLSCRFEIENDGAFEDLYEHVDLLIELLAYMKD